MAFSGSTLVLLAIFSLLVKINGQLYANLPPSPAQSPQQGLRLTLTNQFPLPPYLTNYKVDNVVTDWNSAIQWFLFESNASNTAPRLFAFTHYAMWEAWKANNESSTPADPSAVASYAAMLAMKNLVPLYFDKYDQLVRQHTQNLSVEQTTAALDMAKGPVGDFLANTLIDGFQDPTPITEGLTTPGKFAALRPESVRPAKQYSRTLPLVLPEDMEELDFIANFMPPATVGSDRYSNEYRSVYLYGDLNGTFRSASQTSTALFWGDREASLTTILAQWNRAVIASLPTRVPLEITLSLMAEYNAGMYDCVCSSFYLAFKFQQWRPITAIRVGDEMHSPYSTWSPLLTTPNYPGYPAFGGCYAGFSETFLRYFFGTDKRTFLVTTTNSDNNGYLLPTRSYSSFSQVASEVSQSRYFSGVEFPEDAASARTLGNYIASYLNNGLTLTSNVAEIPTRYANGTS